MTISLNIRNYLSEFAASAGVAALDSNLPEVKYLKQVLPSSESVRGQK